MKPTINHFAQALESTLSQFGIQIIDKSPIEELDAHVITQEITTYIGLVGDYTGNISFAFPMETGKQIASLMMMGMPVEAIDNMSRSALAEIANMICGNALSIISDSDIYLDITPPSVLVGHDVYLLLSYYTTTHMTIQTSLGEMMLNIVIE